MKSSKELTATKLSEETNNFRNNSSKCLFNDVGFCNYRESCRKKHFVEKCKEEKCDKGCYKRHPKECKHGENCDFHKRNICAYDHDNLSKRAIDVIDDDVKKQLEDKVNTFESKFMQELKDMKMLCTKLRSENEELKGENEKKSKELDSKYDDVNNLKGLTGNIQHEVEILKKDNQEQNMKIKSLENKLKEGSVIKNMSDKVDEKEGEQIQTKVNES